MSAVQPTYRRARLLVVDDVLAVRRLIQRGFDEFRLTFAADGREALEVIQAAPHFDLILSDVHMPDLGGLALHAALRSAYPELASRVVFMSGAIDDPDVRTLEAEGMLVIAKPFLVSELKVELIEILERLGMNEPPRAASSGQ
jgi:adenylate cyclase